MRSQFSAIPADEAPNVFLPAAKGGKSDGAAADARYFFGNRYDGLAGAEGLETEMIPIIELAAVAPIALQFVQDVSVGAVGAGAGFESLDLAFTFDEAIEEVDPGPGKLRINNSPENALRLIASRTDVDLNDNWLQYFTAGHSAMQVRLAWGVGNVNHVDWEVEAVEEFPDYLIFVFAALGSADITTSIGESGGEVILFVTGTPPPPPPPNASVRARLVYSAGTSGNLSVDLDWAGGCVVHAKKLSVSRVNYAYDPRHPYLDNTIRVALTVCPGAPHSPHSPTFTLLPMPVLPEAERVIAIPPLARRLSLLVLYELGDAPLSQLVLVFLSRNGDQLHFIDALSTRDALFSDGIPIPTGAASLVLSNRSADTGVQLGAMFHLSF